MARILLLGTWVTKIDEARESLKGRSQEQLTFSGMSSQLEVTGRRIEVERRLIVNDRTWKFGMPRSVIDGMIEQQSDDLFVVVDEPKQQRPGG